MARRIEFVQGGYYHLYNRGCQRLSIFYSEENYRYLTQLLRTYAREHDVSVIAYCLMPNHYHFLLRQNTQRPLSVFMQRVFNRYVKAFNKAYKRTGTLFEGPYKSIHVKDENYLKYLCSYIHRNPVNAKLVKFPDRWKFSNYLEWVEKREDVLVDREFIQSRFNSPEEYIQFAMMDAPTNLMSDPPFKDYLL